MGKSISGRPSDPQIAAARERAMAFAGVGLYRYTFDGTVLFIDRGALTVLDLDQRYPDPGAVAGKNIAELFVYTGPRGRLRQAVREHGHVHDLEYTFQTLNGRVKWARHDAYVVESGAVDEHAVEVIIRDVTESHSAEEALRESERRYRRITEAVTDYMYSVRVESGSPVETVHRAACVAVTGYTAEEFHQDPHLWIRMVPEEDRDRVRNQAARILTQHDNTPIDHRIVRKDGARRWVRNIPVLHFDPQGQLVAYDGLIGDITERWQAEQLLRESEKRYRRITEAVTDYVYTVRIENGRPVETVHGPACEAVTGYRSEELSADPFLWIRMVPEEDRDKVRGQAADILQESVAQPCEHRITRKDGETRWVRNTPVIHRSPEGRLISYDGLVRDITERIELEDQIRQAQKLESLGILAGGIAHDFNNLLMRVLGNVELALGEVGSDSKIHTHLQEIDMAAKRAASLCRQMLAYSGKGKFVIELVDLGEVAAETGRLLETSISKDITMEYDFAPNLPALHGDGTQVRQVVMNLITNAAEAIGDNPGTLTVRTGVRECSRAYLADAYLNDGLPEGHYVFLEITDTGCGMNEETLDKLFDPFFSTKFTGRGLGLAAVLGIVRGHEGAIRVDSKPGRGTTFTVLFPSAGRSVKRVRAPLSGPAAGRAGQTILLVDDEEAIRTIGKRMLQRFGFTVLTAKDGLEGVAVFREHAQDIAAVVLDLTMPHMSGEEAYGEMRAIKEDVRVILSSGYNQQEISERFGEKAFAGMIQKPYQATALLERLRQVLEP